MSVSGTTPPEIRVPDEVTLAQDYDELKGCAAEVAEALEDVLNVIGDLCIDGDLGLDDAKSTRAKLLSLHEKYGRSQELLDSINECIWSKDHE